MEQLTHLPELPSIGSIRKMSPLARREFRNGMLFISPWIFGFLAFTLIPMIATVIFSFMNLKITQGILSPPQFVGFANYGTLLKDSQIWKIGASNSAWGSIWITIRFALIALPVGFSCRWGLPC